MRHNSNIKSMKLYNFVDRIYNEIKELGKNKSDASSIFYAIKFFNKIS